MIDLTKIPVAKNLATPASSRLFHAGEAVSEAELAAARTTGSCEAHFIQNVDFYERKGFQEDYTVRDAAATLFKQEYGTINLFDPDSITRHVRWVQERYKTEGTLSVEPTERELDAYLEKLRAEGLGGEVAWGAMGREFRAFQTGSPEELSDGVDYLASRYVAVLDKLERNFTGEALEAQKAKLEEVYQTGVSNLTDGYAELLRDHLGVSDAGVEDVKSSLNAALAQRVEDYRGVMDEVNRAVAESGADAVWLKNCDPYLAVRLRGTGAGTGSGDAVYSLSDLTAAGQIAKLYQRETEYASSFRNRDEGKIALGVAMADMKAEKLISAGKVGGRMASLLRSARAQAHANVLDAADRYLADREAHRGKYAPKGTYAPMDRALFGQIYGAAMDGYRRTGDATAAIRAGASAAKTLIGAAEKKNAAVLRWNAKDWQNFYTTPEQRDNAISRQVGQLLAQANLPDTSANSPYQNYLDDWRSFLSSIGEAAGVNVTI